MLNFCSSELVLECVDQIETPSSSSFPPTPQVPARYTLVATSLWLFLGDVGSVVGANTLVAVRSALACAGVREFMNSWFPSKSSETC